MGNPEYCLTVKISNNLFKQKMKEFGIASCAELSRLTGINQQTISEIANLKRGAYTAKYPYSMRECVKILCDFFLCSPEDLFPEEVLFKGINKNRFDFLLTSDNLKQQLKFNESDPFELVNVLELSKSIEIALSTLGERERKIIKWRYMNNETLNSIGEKLNISVERVRQIELKALRKLRNPNRESNKHIRDHLSISELE